MKLTGAAFLVVWLAFGACHKQDVNPVPLYTTNCEEAIAVTDSLQLLAQQIVYNEITNTTAHPAKNEILLPAKQCDSVYETLAAIKNLGDANADTIFKLCGIQGYYTDSLLRTITLHILKTSCTDRLTYYNSNPACSPIDSLFALYNIYPTRVKLQPYPNNKGSQYIINFKACKPLNMQALAKQLKKTGLPDDVFLYYTFTIKPYSITMQKTSTHTVYEFGYGWQCSTGCVKWRYWKFSMDKNGEAIFLQSYGDDFPVF